MMPACWALRHWRRTAADCKKEIDVFKTSLLSIVVLLAVTAPLYAGPASPDPIDIQQPDGISFKARIMGDEFQGWTESEETGHTIIHNKSSGYWEYAEQAADGSLRPSGVRVAPKGFNVPSSLPRSLKPLRNKELERRMHQMLNESYRHRLESSSMSSPSSSTSSSGIGAETVSGGGIAAPVSGGGNALIVLISFADRTIQTTPANWYGSVFDESIRSVAKYFRDNSFGLLTISPAAHTQSGNPAGIVSVTIADNHPNYGQDYVYATETTLLNHALAQAAEYVNFAGFDTNGNGILEQSELTIYFIYAGYEASGSDKTPNIWAHAYWTTGTGLTAGTMNVQRWAQNGELNDSSVLHPMGVIAHELGHALCGLPDLYDVSGQNQGLGNFSLMASGSWGRDYSDSYSGTTPTSLDAWSREFLGWSVPIEPAASAMISLEHVLATNSSAYKLVTPATSTTEYFLIENRQPVLWDKGLRGSFGSTWQGGFLILHIDNTAGSVSSNSINSYTATAISPGHQGVVPVQASTASCDMLRVGASCRGHATTLFYQGNNTHWGAATSPSSNYYSGAATTFDVSSISSPASTMTAVFSASISGACGSSNKQVIEVVPTTNLCLSGTAAAIIGIGPWFWSCSGSNGGTTADCMAYATSQQGTLAPFPQNFDSVTLPALPSGWTSVVASGSGGIWRTSAGTVHPSGVASHSTSNLVYFNSFTASSGSAAYLASPAFSLVGKVEGKVSFWMYHDTDKSKIDRIDVYIHTAPALTGAYQIGTVRRYVGTKGWLQYTFDIPATFTGATNYVLINGVSDKGNDIHLDDINVYAVTTLYPLTYTFAGTGYGSVNSTPSGMSCIGTSGSVCTPTNFAGGAAVSLSASADLSSAFNSTFGGWTTNSTACIGTGACSVILDRPINVTGAFNRDKLVKLSTQASGNYGTILEAFGAASAGQTIQVRDNGVLIPFDDLLTINKSITLKGGYDADFTNNNGYTATRGGLSIVLGEDSVIRIQRIIVRE